MVKIVIIEKLFNSPNIGELLDALDVAQRIIINGLL
jgi:hypothetical protein